ncbi:MAG: GAF domain-containing protein [Elusimicrobia bacterium]|nr:GAF domain-containing protein [Elusimicrobiota bacterium]
METDSRIEAYRQAAAAMRLGRFALDIPVSPSDQVGALGRELRELAHGLERRFTEFDRLIRLNHDLNAGVLLEEVLERLYASFKGVIPYDRIGFALLEDEGKTLRAHWAKMEYAYPCLTKGFAAPMAGSSLQPLLESGRPRILNDLREYLALHPASESTRLMVQEGILSSLTCPLRAGRKPVGFLFFSSRFAKTYAQAHVATFLEVAGTVSAVIEKSRLYGELMELNRLKNTFLGMAAHDLRGPLADIQCYADLLSNGLLEGDEARAAAVKDIGRIAESALRLVESLLDSAAIESGSIQVRPVPVRLRDFLLRMQTRGSMLARRKGMEVDLVTAPDLRPESILDPDRIEQALMNLVANAVKFSRPGARILLLARRWEDGSLELGVHDEGPGMSASARAGLFKDFAPGEARPTGGEMSTGLGLAIVKRIMHAHRGTVKVISAQGLGSIFLLRLPPDEATSRPT